MAHPTRVPNKTQMRRYLDEGMTQQEIVDVWERESNFRVSRSSIAMAIERYGLKDHARTRPTYPDMLPWIVSYEHRHLADARMLRLEGRRRAGGRLHPDEVRRLEGWKAQLLRDNAVIHYERDSDEGFFWVPRNDPSVVPSADGLIDLSNAEKAAGGSATPVPMDKRED